MIGINVQFGGFIGDWGLRIGREAVIQDFVRCHALMYFSFVRWVIAHPYQHGTPFSD